MGHALTFLNNYAIKLFSQTTMLSQFHFPVSLPSIASEIPRVPITHTYLSPNALT